MHSRHLPKPERQKTLAAHVIRLSRLLTRERETLPSAYLKDRGLRDAYETYYLPPNLRKVMTPLADLGLHPAGLLEKKHLRVLDLGCGPGTAILGIIDFFGSRNDPPQLEFVAVDQVAENLEAVAELVAERSVNGTGAPRIRTVRSTIERAASLPEKPFDLVMLSNVLNELHAGESDCIVKRIDTIKTIMDRFTASDGSLVIIEPALRETSRDLLLVRDGLLSQGLTVYAPCLCASPCPALHNPRDWCHEDLPWDPPAEVRELDRLTGLRKDSLKFSYLVLRKDGRSLADVVSGADSFRVVSEPLASKGKLEFFLCGREGRKLATRLDKDRTSVNQAFETLRRGSLVDFRGLISDGKRFLIKKETQIAPLFSGRKTHISG